MMTTLPAGCRDCLKDLLSEYAPHEVYILAFSDADLAKLATKQGEAPAITDVVHHVLPPELVAGGLSEIGKSIGKAVVEVVVGLMKSQKSRALEPSDAIALVDTVRLELSANGVEPDLAARLASSVVTRVLDEMSQS